MAVTNPLMPGPSPSPEPAPAPLGAPTAAPPMAGAPQAPGGFLAQVQSQHDASAAQYAKMEEAQAEIERVRAGMDSLTKLGDSVTSEDVVTEAGKLVAKGYDPIQAATILSEMPQDGVPLARWISDKVADLSQKEAKFAPLLNVARVHLAKSAMDALQAHAQANPELQAPVAPSGTAPSLGGLTPTSPTQGNA